MTGGAYGDAGLRAWMDSKDAIMTSPHPAEASERQCVAVER